MMYNGVDELRQSCGGAGFLLTSGIADWWSDAAPLPTFEGVNVVMFQQSTRMLLKQAKKIAAGKKPLDFFAYLSQDNSGSAQNATVERFLDLDFLEKTLAVRAAQKVKEVSIMMEESTASHREKENDLFTIDLIRMARLHIIYFEFRICNDRIKQQKFVDPNVKKLIQIIFRIFALK